MTGNLEVAGRGLQEIGFALSMPRLGNAGGLGWRGDGPNVPEWPESGTKVHLASEWHDWYTGKFGFGSDAQFGWIEHAWSGPGVEPGPYGQAYRLLGTAGFGLAGGVEWIFGF